MSKKIKVTGSLEKRFFAKWQTEGAIVQTARVLFEGIEAIGSSYAYIAHPESAGSPHRLILRGFDTGVMVAERVLPVRRSRSRRVRGSDLQPLFVMARLKGIATNMAIRFS